MAVEVAVNLVVAIRVRVVVAESLKLTMQVAELPVFCLFTKN